MARFYAEITESRRATKASACGDKTTGITVNLWSNDMIITARLWYDDEKCVDKFWITARPRSGSDTKDIVLATGCTSLPETIILNERVPLAMLSDMNERE